MPQIRPTQQNACQNDCQVSDVTSPPTPQVTRAIAYVRATEGATFHPNPVTTPAPVRRDPAYIELANVEPGTTVEIINLSRNPRASFDKEKLQLKLTGRDVRARAAAITLSEEQLEQMDIKPGDQLKLRLVDKNHNASDAVLFELEPDDWRAGRITEVVDSKQVVTGGAQVAMLDGEGERKTILAKVVNDGRPPLLIEDELKLVGVTFSDRDKAMAKTFLDHAQAIRTKFRTDVFRFEQLDQMIGDTALPEPLRDAAKRLKEDKALFEKFDRAITVDGLIGPNDFQAAIAGTATVRLMADAAMEPHSRLTVVNTRSGWSTTVNVGADQKINLDFGQGTIRDGDTLLLSPMDNEGAAGKQIELRYSASCPDGKAAKLSILDARVQGVL